MVSPWRLVPLLLAAGLVAQRGDRAGEAQTLLPATVEVPAAPARTPQEQQLTFRLAAGFAIAPFATEPLVADPVAAAVDAAGRLWVVEMRGYMNDLDARDEAAPNGRIVVLHDDDEDGRADRSTVFADQLVLPRAVLPLRGGALVISPPNLLWCPDADLDLRADRTQVVAGGFEGGLENPEHSGNGLLWGFDHAIHLANDARLIRRTTAGFAVEPGGGGGQWGICHDDRGRLYFNYNEDWLRCDLLPGRYGPRAQTTGGLAALNHRVCADRTVWPIRRTPGVNRGYQPGRLIDWVLAIHTAGCSPHVYRGGWLPADGDVFVCEPAGNLVRRIALHHQDERLQGENVYEAERGEFLASTDERFRPVSLATGFDGALYVVDMYRGVIQHKNFVTSFLRSQIVQRGLERPIGLGRIWRIVPADVPARQRAPSLLAAPPTTLVAALGSDNGTVRDLALRELVQREERSTVDALREMQRTHGRAATRIAALSAQVGLQALTATDVRAALRDLDVGVRTFALQHIAPSLATGDRFLWQALEHCLVAGPACVRWQAVLALGDVAALPGAAGSRDQRVRLWGEALSAHADDAMLRSALAAAANHDLVLVLRHWLAAAPAPPPTAAVRDLAARATKQKRTDLHADLLRLAVELAHAARAIATQETRADGLARMATLSESAPKAQGKRLRP